MTESMIERVARALAKSNHRNGSFRNKAEFDSFIDFVWKGHRSDARAAIEAIRVPTNVMIAAGVKAWGFDYDASSRADGINDNISAEYQAMIDAALKEPGGGQ